MENAVEALKFAFAVMIFALALSISISSFSQANEAVTAIVNMKDRETEYTYVEPSKNLTRTVGVETVVPTMYRAYNENIQIYFYDESGNPLILYYKTDNQGKRVRQNGHDVGINYIDLMQESYGELSDAIEHLDILLGDPTGYDGQYKNQLNTTYRDGLYAFLSQYKFEERLGEYYQKTGASKVKKRVITYKINGTI